MSPLYGQAAWLGESVPVHDDARLIRSADVARGVARSLPSGEALLLRGNGAVTIGMTPGLAVSRMWLLNAACAAWLAARGTGLTSPLSTEEIASWRAAGDDLLPRLWQHLRTRGRRTQWSRHVVPRSPADALLLAGPVVPRTWRGC